MRERSLRENQTVMPTLNAYHLAGTKNATFRYQQGWWPSHQAALLTAKACLETWEHEPLVRVKVLQANRQWQPVAIVYRDRIEPATHGTL